MFLLFNRLDELTKVVFFSKMNKGKPKIPAALFLKFFIAKIISV